jgi:hypothetical protein
MGTWQFRNEVQRGEREGLVSRVHFERYARFKKKEAEERLDPPPPFS